MQRAWQPIRIAALAILLATPLACGSVPTEPADGEGGASPDVTVDGLHRVENPALGEVWAKPDANFASYDQIIVEVVDVSYKRKPRSSTYDRTSGNFALTKHQMEDFRQTMHTVFVTELDKSEFFQVVEEPGETVLRVSVSIIDLVVNVPTRMSSGMDRVYTASAGQMTLILELHDSQSGEILARAADRKAVRAAGAGMGDLYYSNPVTNTDAVSRTFRRWADILRSRLEAVRAIEPSETLEAQD